MHKYVNISLVMGHATTTQAIVDAAIGKPPTTKFYLPESLNSTRPLHIEDSCLKSVEFASINTIVLKTTKLDNLRKVITSVSVDEECPVYVDYCPYLFSGNGFVTNDLFNIMHPVRMDIQFICSNQYRKYVEGKDNLDLFLTELGSLSHYLTKLDLSKHSFTLTQKEVNAAIKTITKIRNLCKEYIDIVAQKREGFPRNYSLVVTH